MLLILKLTATLFLLGCFMTMFGIVVDTAKGYNTKWTYFVYTGLSTVAAGVGLGLVYLLTLLWKM